MQRNSLIKNWKIKTKSINDYLINLNKNHFTNFRSYDAIMGIRQEVAYKDTSSES